MLISQRVGLEFSCSISISLGQKCPLSGLCSAQHVCVRVCAAKWIKIFLHNSLNANYAPERERESGRSNGALALPLALPFCVLFVCQAHARHTNSAPRRTQKDLHRHTHTDTRTRTHARAADLAEHFGVWSKRQWTPPPSERRTRSKNKKIKQAQKVHNNKWER